METEERKKKERRKKKKIEKEERNEEHPVRARQLLKFAEIRFLHPPTMSVALLQTKTYNKQSKQRNHVYLLSLP